MVAEGFKNTWPTGGDLFREGIGLLKEGYEKKNFDGILDGLGALAVIPIALLGRLILYPLEKKLNSRTSLKASNSKL